MSCQGSTLEFKKRSNNFSTKEVDILINLVAKYKATIECRKTDRTSNSTKNEAWLQLSKEFNSISGEAYRNVQILRNKYENIKKRSKQRFTDEKMYRRATGGGPDKPFIITEVDETLKDIIGSQMTGLESEFDGDRENLSSPVAYVDKNLKDTSQSEKFPQTQQGTAAESDCEENEVFGIGATSTSSCNESATATNWSQYTPSQLRTAKSLPLRTKFAKKTSQSNQENIHKPSTQSQLSNKVVTWASSKAEIANEQLKFLHEEHELKIKHMKEKHEFEMKVAREEREERRQFFAQKTALQIELLKQQLNN